MPAPFFFPKSIAELAAKFNISDKYIEPYGKYKAKVNPDILQDFSAKPNGKYILVSAITPTPLGEGKTTTTIGLGMALQQLGKSSSIVLRQSSLGPTFGIKGGGAGGGLAQVIPLDESILHLTGDFHAIGQAHNQIAAQLDNSCYHNNPLNIDYANIPFRRVVDINDRSLRKIVISSDEKEGSPTRVSGFDITTASELMAILALVDGKNSAEALHDLKKRIAKMVIAYTMDGKPVTVNDIKATGAAAVLMRDCIKPNIMQTAENSLVFLHAGPFANIAHGCSSILADRVALKLSDFVVTEAGFAADMGAEKFFDIKCRTSGLQPDVVVLVATIRALKVHSGKYNIVPGKPLPPELLTENPADVAVGAANLCKQIENLKIFGVPVVVAINSFPEDKPSEIAEIERVARQAGAVDVAVSSVYSNGGKGGVELAEKVINATKLKSDFNFLYPLEMPIKDKIHTIATRIYGAKEVVYSELAEEQLKKFNAQGFGNLPVCMAKTPLSLSHDAKLKGVPTNYSFPIRDVRASIGAGFLYPIAGSIMTMPGLGSAPNAELVDVDATGNIVGLF